MYSYEERIYKIAAQYGVTKAAVYAWKKKLLGKVPARMKKQDNVPPSKELLTTRKISMPRSSHCKQKFTV